MKIKFFIYFSASLFILLIIVFKPMHYDEYVKEEQKNTDFDLSDRIKPYDNEKNNEILVSFDCNELNANNFQVLVNLSEILEDSGEEGHMKYEIYTFHINSLKSYEKGLIKV